MDWEKARNITTSLGAVVAVAAALWKLVPVILQWWDRRTLFELSGEAYSDDDVRRYTRYYIQPDCQSVDPSGLEDFRRIVPTRVPLFSAMDGILRSPGTERFLIILADSGMGKTAFLLNYYARHRRRWWWRRRGIELRLVPLNQPDAGETIAAVPAPDRKKTVLFLDALDEDQRAIHNHRQRLSENHWAIPKVPLRGDHVPLSVLPKRRGDTHRYGRNHHPAGAGLEEVFVAETLSLTFHRRAGGHVSSPPLSLGTPARRGATGGPPHSGSRRAAAAAYL